VSEPPPVEAPWWQATPRETEIGVALVTVDHAGPVFDWNEIPGERELRRRARYVAGVEYIARAFGAAQPLVWKGDRVTLFLSGASEDQLPAVAFRAAKELWERLRLDLNLPARIAAHVARIRWDPGTDASTAEVVALCDRLHGAAPPGSVLISEDVALALPLSVQNQIAQAGTITGVGVPAYLFPASSAQRGAVGAHSAEGALWESARRYALGPDLRLVRYVGFRLQRKQPPILEIEDVFVPPEVELRPRQGRHHDEPSPPRRRRPGAKSDAEQDRVLPLRDLLGRHRHVVFLGDPGAGKTTLLRWIAVTAARGRFASATQLGIAERLLPLPVSVGRLAELRRDVEGGRASVPAVLARYVEERLRDVQDLGGTLERELEAGRCLILLDGLDEVRTEERHAVHDWLASFTAAYPKNHFIASSRIVGYTGFDLPGGVEALVRPFDKSQVERYVRTFHRAYLQSELDVDDVDRATAEAERLIAALDQSPRLGALARNPFMLSALSLIHRAEGRLPRHRVQAYELFARALCETWAEARRLVAGTSHDATLAYEEEALPILGVLAHAMHERYPTGVAPEAFVLATLARALGEREGVSGAEAEQAARAFLETAGKEVQILLERGAGQWGFLHLTFQEFFTAAGLHSLESFEEIALRHLFDPRWEEVLRLGVGYMALVQKRPIAARRFVEKVLSWDEPEPRAWLSRVLKMQVPIAALLAAEAGDALPAVLQERVAEELAAWVCDPPSNERSRECLKELSLTEFAGRVEGALLRRVKGGSSSDRAEALSAFLLLGTSSRVDDELIKSLSDPHEEVRKSAAWVLFLKGHDELRDPLQSLLQHERVEVRAAAAEVILGISDAPFTALIEILHDPAEKVREAAILALNERFLGELDDQEHAANALLLAMHDVSSDVRSYAAFDLAHLSERTGVVEAALLRAAQHDPDGEVRAEAAYGLRDVKSEEAIDTMIAALEATDDGDLFSSIADALAAHPWHAQIENRLISRLQSTNERTKASAVQALGSFHSEAALRCLLMAIGDASPALRESACYGLSWQDDARARGAMIKALGDPEPDVRLAAAQIAFTANPGPAIDALLAMTVHDDSEEVRRRVIRLFKYTKHEGRLAVMVAALRDVSPRVREEAASVLAEMNQQAALEPLLMASADENHEVRRAVVRALGEIGSPTAIPRLVELAAHEPAARAALWKIAERLLRPEE
jgi:HEAT repeat protein